MSRSEAVDAYLAGQPPTHRATLEALREQIHQVLPDAEEKISYGFPSFTVGGKGVVWIAGWKKHCSIYPLTDPFLAANAEALASYAYGSGTLRFAPDAPPPAPLIEALVRSRLAEVRQ